jgi:hypothetical protein
MAGPPGGAELPIQRAQNTCFRPKRNPSGPRASIPQKRLRKSMENSPETALWAHQGKQRGVAWVISKDKIIMPKGCPSSERECLKEVPHRLESRCRDRRPSVMS